MEALMTRLTNRTPVKGQHAVDVLLREMPVVNRNNEIYELVHIDAGQELFLEIVLRGAAESA